MYEADSGNSLLTVGCPAMIRCMAHLHRFYVDPNTPGEGTVILEGDEAHHALRVARVRVGDAVALFDGRGRLLRGHVVATERRSLEVDIDAVEVRARPARRVVVLQAYLNRDKPMESIVRGCTELGVSEICVFRAERSERKPHLGSKWQRIAIESCKQCGRLWLPEFRVVEDLVDALADVDGSLLLASMDIAPVSLGDSTGDGDVYLLIGPEGDLTTEETELALAHGASPVSLGETTYRSEVAVRIAVTLVQYHLGEFGK